MGRIDGRAGGWIEFRITRQADVLRVTDPRAGDWEENFKHQNPIFREYSTRKLQGGGMRWGVFQRRGRGFIQKLVTSFPTSSGRAVGTGFGAGVWWGIIAAETAALRGEKLQYSILREIRTKWTDGTDGLAGGGMD